MSHVLLIKASHKAARFKENTFYLSVEIVTKVLCKGHGNTERWKIGAIFAIYHREVMKIK